MSTGSNDSDKISRNRLLVIMQQGLESLLLKFSCARNERRWRSFLLLTTALLVTLSVTPRQHFFSANFKAGAIATADIRATQDFLVEDRPLTEKKRAEAVGGAPYIYLYNPKAPQELLQRFEKALSLVKAAKNQGTTAPTEEIRQSLSGIMGGPLSPQEADALFRIKNEQVFLAELGQLAERLFSRKIIEDRRDFEHDRVHGVEVVDQESRRGRPVDDQEEYADLAEVRARIAKSRLGGGDGRDLEIRKGLVARYVKPTVMFSREYTDARKNEAQSAVRPVLFQVKTGEMIVRIGERITEEEALKLEAIYQARNGINQLFLAVGVLGLVLILFYFPFRFARKNIRKFQPSNKDLLLLACLSAGTFIAIRFCFTVSTAMGGAFPSIDTASYIYLFPFAAGAMLARVVLNSEVALVYCAVCAPLMGIMFNNSLPVVIYGLIGGIIGAHGVRHCTNRGTIYTAGMKISVVNVALAVSFQVFNDNLFSQQTVYCVLFAFAGGLINSALVTGAIPLVETIFHYTTDIKLLEMANLNSPLLRDLMVRAPGTYHHSVVVGNLVEAAAEAINANPLLARVAAYHHDVGKLSKPLYFIENVGGGENRHDKLSPNMSALILIAHVKEGAEMAKEHRLGLPIVDIIRQSHGTQLITFFYQKARTLALAEGKTVDERDFRYPGPKPQTREAGLVLLADCVEAASRTLINPTAARIQGMVQKIINNIFIDGQLDECELTLKNLHEIAKSFNRVLAGIYHHRIDYPEPAYKEKRSGGRKALNDSANEQTTEEPDQLEDGKRSGGDDLKRLGISR